MDVQTQFLRGYDVEKPQCATSGSAGYDLCAVLTRPCLDKAKKKFFSWKGRRYDADQMATRRETDPGEFETITDLLQKTQPTEVAKVKAMSQFPTQHLHLKVMPGETVKIPLGIKTAFSEGMVCLLFPRASSADREFRLGNCVGVIDSDYRGEWLVAIRNEGQTPLVIQHGTRIVQAVFFPLVSADWMAAEELPESVRSEGGFGSTGWGASQKELWPVASLQAESDALASNPDTNLDPNQESPLEFPEDGVEVSLYCHVSKLHIRVGPLTRIQQESLRNHEDPAAIASLAEEVHSRINQALPELIAEVSKHFPENQ